MSNWSIAILVIGVAGGAACRQDAAAPPLAPAPSASVETQEPLPRPMPKEPTAQPPRSVPPATPIKSFAVYTLSRGKGVPEEAREAMQQVAKLAEDDRRRGVKVTVETTRIGIEGETRVCIAYEDPQEGTRAYGQARDLVKGVDLVNLAAEPCADAANNQQEKES